MATQNLPAIPEEDNVGLEDFDESDYVMPSLRLDHTEGCLVDTLSGEQFQKMDVILLGLIKQRILWPAELSEAKEAPLCRSLDHTWGTPDPENPSRFPWKASGFKPSDQTENGLPCEGCALKDWGSNPKNDTPWCTEQFTFGVMLPMGDPEAPEAWSPAVLTLQRSNIKAARAYMTGFKRSEKPLFTKVTKLSLTHNKRGTVKFSTVNFAMGVDVPVEKHAELASQFRKIRDWVRTPRQSETTVDEDEVTPATASTKTAAAIDEDDIDF